MDSIGLLVWDLNAELLQCRQILLPYIASVVTNLLDRHNHLYSIQTVETEVVVEVRLGVKLHYMSLNSLNCSETSGIYLGSVLDLYLR